jgi:hypothetical protein
MALYPCISTTIRTSPIAENAAIQRGKAYVAGLNDDSSPVTGVGILTVAAWRTRSSEGGGLRVRNALKPWLEGLPGAQAQSVYFLRLDGCDLV